MKSLSSKRRVAAVAAVILLLMFLLRPGASRLKSRIILSISAGVGRPVDIGSVHIRLLPRPGFDLQNLVVYDDPSFGAEPILRASEVTADLRLVSLMRGRMEIARLDLTEPSLNFVHGDGGRWNVEELLERTAHIPLAPTSKAKSEPRPGFPYIEATSGRINFKSGPEKKPYALTNADFALWQESENTWGVRLKAQPVRTDLNLTDTGLLQLNGTWQRAETFRDTPMQFSFEWSRAQMGQFTKLFTGNDKGWRGAIQLDVTLAGTPAKLRVSSAASIDDFRRYDITSGSSLRLAGSCDAEYSSVNHEFHEVICSAPVGQGLITLTGDMGLLGSHHYAIVLRAENVPASALVMLTARAKKNLPDDLTAEGMLNGSLSTQEDAAAGVKVQSEGQGEITDFLIESAANKTEFGPVRLPFRIAVTPEVRGSGRRGRSLLVFPGPHVELGPVALGAAHGTAQLDGWINRAGYTFILSGESEVGRTLRLARMVGLAALTSTAEGTAELNLEIKGAWSGLNNGTVAGFIGPQATGSVKLRNVRAVPHGLGGPVEISSADIELSPDKVHVAKLNAKAAGTNWTGWLEMPRGCGALCPVRFSLNTNQIVLSQLSEWAGPRPKKQPWYRVLETNSQAGPSILASLDASGRVSADRLQIRKVTASHVVANVSVKSGKMQISDLEADLVGGKHRGAWEADFTVKPAICRGSGKLTGLSLDGFADAMNDPWITGTANADYEVRGECAAGFWQAAVGTVHVEAQNAVLPHLFIGDEQQPLRVTYLSGQGRLDSGTIQIKNAELDSAGEKYRLTGTATLQRELDLKLERSAVSNAGYAVTGTLAEPHVATLTRTEQARLKPEPAK